jgi:hypothetical protein
VRDGLNARRLEFTGLAEEIVLVMPRSAARARLVKSITKMRTCDPDDLSTALRCASHKQFRTGFGSGVAGLAWLDFGSWEGSWQTS